MPRKILPETSIKKPKNAEVSSCLQRLVSCKNEAEVQNEIRDLLRLMDLSDVSLEERAGRGSVDILSFSAKLVIETKAQGKLDPKGRGSGPGETQKKQLARYLRELTENDGLFADEVPWRGVLTDGRTWHVYDYLRKEVSSGGGKLSSVSDFRLQGGKQDFNTFKAKYRLYFAPKSRLKKPAPPHDLGISILKPFSEKLRGLAEEAEEDQYFETKLKVWKSIMGSAGMLPPERMETKTRRLFREHTALVVTAKGILYASGGGTVEPALDDGFISWLVEVEGGEQSYKELFKDLSGYEWSDATRDVMRTAYEQLIDREDRKEFGEYYTPDWLAAAVCERVLDVDWMNRALDAVKDSGAPLKGMGVLDPACGSGTFLFHAARRIVSHAFGKRGFSRQDACHAAAALVHGVDIHPVAVEMSRAVLRTALPYLDAKDTENRLNVYVGDSLQTGMSRTEALWGGDHISILSTRNERIDIPRELIDLPDFSPVIKHLVSSALRRKPLHLQGFGLGRELEGRLEETHSELTKICEDEGNHVWAWRILNTAKLMQLADMDVDRLVGNPPWLVANDTAEGTRKQAIEGMKKAYGLSARGSALRTSSAKGDLAALFACRAITLYLAEEGKFAFVLPGSALVNQVWEPFRKGQWGGPQHQITVAFEAPWNLDGVREHPFPHAPNGACVVLGEKGEARAMPEKVEFWEKDDVKPNQDWESMRRGLNRLERPIHGSLPGRKESIYRKDFGCGVMMRPLCLSITVDWREEGDRISFKTYRSTKKPWKGQQYEGEMEAEATHALLRSQTLGPFCAKPDARLLAPLDGVKIAALKTWPKDKLPLAEKWFRRHDKVFQKYRSEKSALTLLGNIDWKRTFTRQYAKGLVLPGALRKVVYNKSGNTLRAARIRLDIAVNDKVYYAVLPSREAAAYLTAILNAPCLRAAWNTYKTSKLDYDLNPLRSIPVPRFDKNSRIHKELVTCCRDAEKAAGKTPGRDEALMQIYARIDRCVKKLLPEYIAEDPGKAGTASEAA